MTQPREEADTGSTAPEPTAPEPTAPEPMESTPTEPAAPAPTDSTPIEPTAPEPIAPEPTAPERTAPPPPVAGWVAPEGGGSGGGRRGCLIAVIVVAALLFFGFVGLLFLGNQVRTVLAGTIQFGTGGSGCSVTGTATTFPASASIRSVAFLKEDVVAGTTLTTVVTFADGTSESSDQTIDTTAGCVIQGIEPGLSPGHYGLEYRVGSETVAKGGFDITP